MDTVTISISNLTKRFGDKGSQVVALSEVSIAVEPGEVVALLGPSGCGKTTLLRCVAGLEVPDEGCISVGDTPVFDASKKINVPPERRHVGMVFQSYALWPNMSVSSNVAYPLRCRRVPKAKRRETVADVLTLMGCGHLGDRYPGQLSGGQQQRIALARAIVAEPAVVLFDEPLSNLDARLRENLRFEIRALQQRVGFTGLYVTHDRNEAWVIADRVAVMRDGRILQVGGPSEIHSQPTDRFVAEFIGDMNCSTGTLTSKDDRPAVAVGGEVLAGRDAVGSSRPGAPVALAVPPRSLQVFTSGEVPQTGWNEWDGTVVKAIDTPSGVEIYIRIEAGETWKVLSPRHVDEAPIGSSVVVGAHESDCLILPDTGGTEPDVVDPPILAAPGDEADDDERQPSFASGPTPPDGR